MRAISTLPGKPHSADLEDLPEPVAGRDLLLVQAIAVGICGTDMEILSGQFGTPAPGRARLIIGHESLGRVLAAPDGCGLAAGDLVVGVVRRPDPVPCPNCATTEWDMCRNGQYTERGIKGLDGYAAERYTLEPAYAVNVPPALGTRGVLLEPTSIVAKAWEHIDRIGARSVWRPQRVLVTGSGPIGLLAAMMAKQRGLDVHVADRIPTGRKPDLVRTLGATYHATASVKETGVAPDIVIECTGAEPLIVEVMQAAAANGIVCLTGIASGARQTAINVAALNTKLVLDNNVVFGTVNANLRHYRSGLAALERADPAWLDGLITRRVPLISWRDAVERREGDVKTVIEF